MIVPWNKVKVVKNGEVITFGVQLNELSDKLCAQASPIYGKFLIILNRHYEFPENIPEGDARTEFRDNCALMAVAGKLFPDSSEAVRAFQKMRASMQREDGTADVIVNL